MGSIIQEKNSGDKNILSVDKKKGTVYKIFSAILLFII